MSELKVTIELIRNKNIVKVEIKDITNATEDELKEFGAVLENNSSIISLKVNHLNNKLRSSGLLSSICELIKKGKLNTLSLNFSKMGDEEATAIAKALMNNTTLESLDLNYNNIGPKGARALAGSLKNNTTLTNLDLSTNYIGLMGPTALAKALYIDKGLTSPDSFDIMRARALFEGLNSNTTLKSLKLRSNYIGNDEVIGLAEELKINKGLTSLDLVDNKIGPEGANAFTESLKNNTTLIALDLSDNNIGPEGANAFAESLKNNTTLTSLNLINNNIGSDGANAFAKSLNGNTTITSLDLSDNNISRKLLEPIEKHTNDNRNYKIALVKKALDLMTRDKNSIYHHRNSYMDRLPVDVYNQILKIHLMNLSVPKLSDRAKDNREI